MIFNEYDKALWLILKNDRKNRNKILDFINSIPCEFILKIQEKIEEYNQYKIKNIGIPIDDRKVDFFSGEIYTSDGFFYSFNIDTSNDLLFIGRSIYENGAYYNDFRISLASFDLNIDNLVDQNIGGILSASLFDERVVIDYKVIDTRLGILFLKSINNDIFRVCGVLNKDIPCDYSLEDVRDRFSRCRRKYWKGKLNV